MFFVTGPFTLSVGWIQFSFVMSIECFNISPVYETIFIMSREKEHLQKKSSFLTPHNAFNNKKLLSYKRKVLACLISTSSGFFFIYQSLKLLKYENPFPLKTPWKLKRSDTFVHFYITAKFVWWTTQSNDIISKRSNFPICNKFANHNLNSIHTFVCFE